MDWNKVYEMVGSRSRNSEVENSQMGIRGNRGNDGRRVWGKLSAVGARMGREGQDGLWPMW